MECVGRWSVLVLGLLYSGSYVSGFYYGRDASVTVATAITQCQSLGLRLAVLETRAEYDSAKAFLNTYNSLWGKSKSVWIGLQRDATPTVFKWIDGSALTWAPLYADPWKDGGTPSTDVTKACIKMEWGSSLPWKDHECAATEDFLCEGFLLTPSSQLSWSGAKSSCESMGMKLASLKTTEINEAAIKYINVRYNIAGMSPADLWHGFYKTTSSVFTFEDGTSCTSGVYGSVHNAYPWHPGEPDSSSPCIRLKYMGSQQFVWADYGCSSTFRFLCQDQFTTIPTTTTTPTTTSTTTTTPATTTTTELATTTKPWWFVEYSEDGKAIGANGLTFDKSSPPARFGVIGLAIGFSVFSMLTVGVCAVWFCCLRSKDDYRHQEEEVEEKPKKVSPMDRKPHGLQYIA
ncbi:macrophage mannose receptor 1-like [Crassostrea angulata]|uniref:macrophage mannose receptor 1-like n=1 Tax=Magallana angulata TaxID=2784310 RepID=UPI0022B198DB|nr:macrophage mannose receptor 1-like [Crassostrea angulata]